MCIKVNTLRSYYTPSRLPTVVHREGQTEYTLLLRDRRLPVFQHYLTRKSYWEHERVTKKKKISGCFQGLV